MSKLMNWSGSLLVVLAGLLALVIVPSIVELYVLIDLSIYASFGILALSLGLVWGYGGILSLGQAAFFGLGGYAYAVAAINLGDSASALLIGIAIPACFAAVLGYFMFWGNVSDVYLGVMTLTVALILHSFISQTAGDQWVIGNAPLGGLNGIPGTPILSWPWSPDASMTLREVYSVTVVLLLCSYLGCKAYLASNPGRILVAARENELRCQLLGYNVRRYKQLAFVIGGGLAGLAGVLFANSVFVNPAMFGLSVNAQSIIWVIVGGLGTLIGPLVGAFLVQFLTKSLGSISQVPGLAWLDPNLVLGLFLVLFVLFVPKGLAPLFRSASLGLFPLAGKAGLRKSSTNGRQRSGT